jgi:hypothetical protein
VTLTRERPATPRPTEAEDLFEEAHRRRRRRRWFYVAAITSLVVVLIVGVGVAVASGGPDKTVRPHRAPLRGLTAVANPPASSQVAWVDYNDQLHIGDVATGAQRVVRQANAEPTTTLVALDGWIWSIRTEPERNGQYLSGNYPKDGAVGFNPTTGGSVLIPHATQVFLSLDRRFLFVDFYNPFLNRYAAPNEVHKAAGNGPVMGEYTPDGRSLHRSATFPRGWYLSDPALLGNPSPVTANGILVQSEPEQIGTTPSKLGLWNPSSDRVRVLGPVWKVIDTFTAPHARSSLMAWLPGSCERPQAGSCSLRITNTGTGTSASIANPLGEGFNWGGAFSPDGRTLAVFLSVPAGGAGPVTQLALVNVPKLSIEVVPDARINNGDALAWAVWLSGGQDLLAGAVGGRIGNGIPPDNHYVVNPTTLAISPFSFLADGNTDVNFTVVALTQ